MAHLAVSVRKIKASIGNKDRYHTFLQVLHLGGTPYTGLTERTGAGSFDLESQRAAFRKLYADELSDKRFGKAGLHDLPGETPKAHLIAIAQSIAESRMFLSDVSSLAPAEIEATRKQLVEELRDRGHLAEFNPSPTVHIHETSDGRPFLSCHPAYLHTKETRSLEQQLLYQTNLVPTKTSYNPTAPEAVFEFPPGTDIAAWAARVESEPNCSGFRLVNHTPQPFLALTKGNLRFSDPWLVSAERGVELFLTHGNFQEVENLIPSSNCRVNEHGFLMRGHQAELAPIYSRLYKADANGLRYTNDRKRIDKRPPIVAEDPTPVAYCDPHPFIASRLNVTDRITDLAMDRANAYQLCNGDSFTDAQRVGVAWCSSLRRTGSLISDDTGSGKTLVSAAAADIATSRGSSVLVVAPVGLLAQWIREIYDKLPIEGKGQQPELADAEIARWMRKLSRDPKRPLHDLDAYAQIRHRFHFLPISSLECGLEVQNGFITVPPDGGGTKEKEASKSEIEQALERKPDTLIVDEIQEFRRRGAKFDLLMALRRGSLNRHPIKRVIAGSATPVHFDAPDLGNIFALLGASGFEDMDDLSFAKQYCERKQVYGAKGWTSARGVTVYDFSGFRADKMGEIGTILADCMIARDKGTLFPGKFKPVRIHTPLYKRDLQHGVEIDEIVRSGEMVSPTSEQLAEINGQVNPIKRAVKIAEAKVDTTVAAVESFLKDPKRAGQKVVAWTSWEECHTQIGRKLQEKGIPFHQMTGTPNSWRDHHGVRMPSKVRLIDSFAQNPESRVLVATLGAAATGLDGLQYVASTAIGNDFSLQPGVQEQAAGRLSRGLFRVGEPPAWDFAELHMVLLDHPVEKARYQTMMNRMHIAKFTRLHGLVGELDSDAHEVKALIARDAICRAFAGDGLHIGDQRGVRGSSVAINAADAERLEHFRNERVEEDVRRQRDGVDISLPNSLNSIECPSVDRSVDLARARAAGLEVELRAPRMEASG